MTTQELLEKAKAAKGAVALWSTEEKNAGLMAMAFALETHMEEILAANREDMAREEGHIPPVMLDRLALTPERIADMAQGIREVSGPTAW